MARLPVAAATTPHELSRDIYGFTVRPHHLQLYKLFAEIYKEEEAERSARWEEFLSAYGESFERTRSVESKANNSPLEGLKAEYGEKIGEEGSRKFKLWCDVRASLQPVEEALRHRSEKSSRRDVRASSIATATVGPSPNTYVSQESEDGSDDEFFDAERVDPSQDGSHSQSEINDSDSGYQRDGLCPWKEELDALVRGGVPMALRGEVWQVFVGSSSCRVPSYYQTLLTLLTDGGINGGNGLEGFCNQKDTVDYKHVDSVILKKLAKQIEKDLPRTFPGHPALDVNGRNALRNLLIAYACYNPDVGYCQAMNFFAGLLLLMMPEENAFWTLVSILDYYFDGYYTEKMLEFQVDQMVLEELARLHFPRLMTHLDTLGLQVAWMCGPWFLSIFINVLPWESVLRVWDVLLYEGNRSMLFRTALAILEIHGAAVLTAKDAGDAVTMLQSLVSASFDSSQLVLTACVGYQTVQDSYLEELRKKYHPRVLAMLTEQSMWRKPYGPLTSCEKAITAGIESKQQRGLGPTVLTQPAGVDDGVDAFLKNSGKSASSVEKRAFLSSDIGPNGLPDKGSMLVDLMSEVSYMKLDLSRALEERRVANIRAEELETAFMELVKEDNRRLLSAKAETLEAEVMHLRCTVADKFEQNQAMIQVMARMEHELEVTQEARRLAEEDAETQRNVLNGLQVKYESVMASIKELEGRAVRAECLLEATSQHTVLSNGAPALKPLSISVAGEEPSRWAWSWNTAK